MTHPGAAMCARCGLNKVGYTGREWCWGCVPRPQRVPLAQCSVCGVNPVAHRLRDTCYACVARHGAAQQICGLCGVNPTGYATRGSCYTCVPRQRPAPAVCSDCGIYPTAYMGRATCYQCVPRRRRAPLVCKRCGSADVYTRLLCRRCHRSAPLVDNCRDCFAWGVTRHHKWVCEACRGWRRSNGEPAECPTCNRHVVINDRGSCRLCCRTATIANQHTPTHRAQDIATANHIGQQLFFADLILKKRGKQPPETTARPIRHHRLVWPAGIPNDVQQLVLFDWPRHLTNDYISQLGAAPIPALAIAMRQAIDDHGDRHGWSSALRDITWRGIRVLLAIQDTPGARILTSHTVLLIDVDHAAQKPVLDVLTAIGMLHDDLPPPHHTWFDTHTAGLPDQMRKEVATWFHTLCDGSRTPPRSRPRNPQTAKNYLTAVLPGLKMWADHGHQSLREITTSDVEHAIATSTRRSSITVAYRSMFRALKARKLVFINPAARLRDNPTPPLSIDPVTIETIRRTLHSPNHACAAIAALGAFHALSPQQLCNLRLIDIRDGSVHVADNTIPLADPARTRINTWLTERARLYPNTINPYLFIHNRTAPRTTRATTTWLCLTLGLRTSQLRQDRILNEAIATSGDSRRLSDLFGISIPTAQRYVDAITRPDEHAFDNA